MPRFRVVETWKYRVTFEVEAKNEDDAAGGIVQGTYEEVSRDDGEYLDTVSVEAVKDEAKS
jgi:hypothetical protein